MASPERRDGRDHGDAVRVIALRYAGACAVCRRPLEPRTRAGYRAADRAVICLACLEPSMASDDAGSSVAGASARRKYERRRARRERRVRERLPRIGGALLALSAEPQHQRAWRRGAEGEERLARRLEQLTGDVWVRLLHDRRIPGGRANIDHLAIGPGGVTVIDAKRYRGKIEVRRSGGLLSPRVERLFVAGRDRTPLVEGVRAQIAAVRRALAASDAGELDISGVLRFIDGDGLPLLKRLEIDEIAITGPRGAAKRTARAGALTPHEVQRIHAALAAALPPA